MARPDHERSILTGKALEDAQDFGARLHAARKDSRLSQRVVGERLAAAMGRHLPFSQATISMFENGKLPIDDSITAAASNVFGVSSLEFAAPLSTPREGAVLPAPESFREWKQLIGLPEEFPHLATLNGEEAVSAFYVGAIRVGLAERIAAGTGIDMLAVEVQRGHGATTLSQRTHEITKRESLYRNVLPVRIGLDELDKDQFSQNPRGVVDGSIRQAISQNLAEDYWQMVTSEDVLTALRYLSRMGSVPELLTHLRRNMKNVSMQVDLSSRDSYFDPKAYGDKVAGLQTAIIHIQEDLKQSGALPHALTEMYFGDKSSLEMVENFRGNFSNKVQYPWYRPLDVYEMLAARYSPNIEVVRTLDRFGQEGLVSTHDKQYTRQEALGMIMSPDVLTGIVAPDIPLAESMRLLERRLERGSAQMAQSGMRLNRKISVLRHSKFDKK